MRSGHHLYMNQTQNALQRLLAVMLDEHSSLIGLVGTHSLLLFGSDILQCDIATASASTKPESSDSSDSPFELSEHEAGALPLTMELLPLLFPSDCGVGLVVVIWDGAPG